MGHKILGVTTSCSDFFFDSVISVAWPVFQTPIRSEQKIRVEIFVRRGQKGSNFESVTPVPDIVGNQKFKIACVVACCPSIAMQTVQHCKGTAWLRGAAGLRI